MTGIASITHNIRAGVVGVGVQEADRGMAVATLRAGDRVGAGRDVISVGSHTCGHCAVVATCASPANIRMIKAAIRQQFQKMGGVVALITFSLRLLVKF